MLETKIRNLMKKHQNQADEYHRTANLFKLNGLHRIATKWDKKAHPHESFALELRLILK